MDKLPQYAALKHLMFKSFHEILQKMHTHARKEKKICYSDSILLHLLILHSHADVFAHVTPHLLRSRCLLVPFITFIEISIGKWEGFLYDIRSFHLLKI